MKVYYSILLVTKQYCGDAMVVQCEPFCIILYDSVLLYDYSIGSIRMLLTNCFYYDVFMFIQCSNG